MIRLCLCQMPLVNLAVSSNPNGGATQRDCRAQFQSGLRWPSMLMEIRKVAIWKPDQACL
ncbi:MAG: hypothetical protein C0465_27095 [Ralstonia sp.]|nr:hypothetical protein [Ralstonia sp.]